ncbi:MAG: heme-copper oxidase subunit III [Myxococcales bacterium]|nr:heme-copper oxidase subunit III [Myxococcales bacterium]
MAETAMGELLPYRPHRESETTASVGMVVLLASLAMVFATFLFAYLYVRSRTGPWPPPGLPEAPLILPALNTGLLALSSAVLQLGLASLRRGGTHFGRWAFAAASLGAAFLAMQGLLWVRLLRLGLGPDAGTFGSALHGLTWLHAAHVLVGLVGLSVVGVRAHRGAYRPARHLGPKLWAWYWHFVGAVWALMFVLLFLY